MCFQFAKNAPSALYFWIRLRETVTSVSVAPAPAPQIHYFAIRDWTVSKGSTAPRTKVSSRQLLIQQTQYVAIASCFQFFLVILFCFFLMILLSIYFKMIFLQNVLAVLSVRLKLRLMEYVTAKQETRASRAMIVRTTFTAALKMDVRTFKDFRMSNNHQWRYQSYYYYSWSREMVNLARI